MKRSVKGETNSLETKSSPAENAPDYEQMICDAAARLGKLGPSNYAEAIELTLFIQYCNRKIDTRHSGK